MVVGKSEVKPLFMEPIFNADISDVITDKQVEFIRNLKMVKNKTNLISENLYIFNEEPLKPIADAIQEVLDIYTNEIMGIDQSLYVTQSWSLVNPPGSGMHGHSHSNSVISGSFYFDEMVEPVAKMIFSRHRTYRQIELNPRNDRQNIFNTPLNIVEPKQGHVFLFASDLQHYVEVNESNGNRSAIAFNTFIRGKIGDFRDVSELTLS